MHSGDVVGCRWTLILQKRDIRVHRDGERLRVSKIEASEDGVNIGLLGKCDGAILAIPSDLDSK